MLEFEKTWELLMVVSSFAIVVYLFQQENNIQNMKNLFTGSSKKES